MGYIVQGYSINDFVWPFILPLIVIVVGVAIINRLVLKKYLKLYEDGKYQELIQKIDGKIVSVRFSKTKSFLYSLKSASQLSIGDDGFLKSVSLIDHKNYFLMKYQLLAFYWFLHDNLEEMKKCLVSLPKVYGKYKSIKIMLEELCEAKEKNSNDIFESAVLKIRNKNIAQRIINKWEKS